MRGSLARDNLRRGYVKACRLELLETFRRFGVCGAEHSWGELGLVCS
jgi:hypothetical protein